MRGQAKRASEIGDRLASLQSSQLAGRLADLHKDDGNSAFLPIPIGDGQRDTLTPVVRPDYNELPRLSFLSDIRGHYLEKMDFRGKVLPGYDLVHFTSNI
jgi:hypothetical protein